MADEEVPTPEELFARGIRIEDTLGPEVKKATRQDILNEVINKFAYSGLDKAQVQRVAQATLYEVERLWGKP